MPIYEYQCKKCHFQMEAIQGFNDEALLECPECHDNSLEKLLSSPSFHLKGTGWYQTDFKNPQSKPSAAETKSDNKEKTCSKTDCGSTKSSDSEK